MDFAEATRSYEKWMQQSIRVVPEHIRDKHRRMRRDPFQFFRATYYRWAQLWPQLCSKCSDAPVVLSIGDVHVDSFGTWRDVEGRLCWGLDDFDEAFPLPYTNDLVRLASSVKIARKLALLKIRTKPACEILLKSYEKTLRGGGCPIVLAEEETHLERLGIAALKRPERFWKTLNGHPAIQGRLPRGVKELLRRTFPDRRLKYRVIHREAGLGSLGQPRFVAIADCYGGCIAREAKRLLPSAHVWLNGRTINGRCYYKEIIARAVRSRDPYQKATESWLIRRLSPDSDPIHLEELSGKRDEETLLSAMGTEIANVHLGDSKHIKAVLDDLRRRRTEWLPIAAKKMAKVCIREWKEFES